MASSPHAKPPEDSNSPPVTPAKRKPSATTTPIRKGPAQNKRTPTSAPVRGKKPEPTLLGDFLLGRPSPHRARTRRKSLDVVKAEMRAEVVEKVQAPGGVKDRVKQWQKTSAAEVVADPLADAASQPDDAGGWENEEESVDEEERLRIKFREAKRKKSPVGRVKVAEVAAPKKRVISDSHWMKQKKRSPPRSGMGAPIPKNFLQATAMNPPLQSKMQDWVKRTEGDETEAEKPRDKPRSRKRDVSEGLKPSRTSTPEGSRVSAANSFDDGIRVKPGKHSIKDDRSSAPSSGRDDDGIRIRPSKRRPKEDNYSKGSPKDDGIRITPSKSDDGRKNKSNPSSERNYPDDGIRVKPSRDNSPDEAIRVTPARRSVSRKRLQDDETSDAQTPTRKKGEKNQRVHSESIAKRVPSSRATSDHAEEDDRFSWVTRENSKQRQKTSQTPPESLDDVPFGNSAFSVLDLPLGAEAGTMKRPPPKRNPSFAAVPKVLKKVFNEGMKIAHDTVEPPRGGTNQPPSIESWLNGTTDPFVEQSESKLDVPVSPSRRRSYKEDDQSERELTDQRDAERSESRRKRRVRSSHEREETIVEEDKSPLENRKTRDTLPSMENSPPLSPTGLKRTPATHRNVTSPKSGRKLPFLDAFRGESTTTRSKSASNPFIDITGLRERDINRSSPDPSDLKSSQESSFVPEDSPRKRSPRQEQMSFEDTRREKLQPPGRKTTPTFGGHRLSTIASIETFSTSSSATGTGSELSQTTVTQATVLTAPTGSSLSRNSHLSRNSQKSKGSGLKRRLTKHSDLMSVLSLPDVVEPGRKTSIKSARSIRTTRTKIATATVHDLMRELAEDEAKYIRELNTLVDGVIPVLLTCVLSKSDSAIASGLFDPNSGSSTTDPSFTKPIVDMGISLEKLKKLHKRIPLVDHIGFINWAVSAHQTYSDYLAAWRAGFNDVVVNLAPASPSQAGTEDADLDTMPRDENGDVLGANGQRADVSYFLKRPLVRIKYLEKVIKGLDALTPTDKSQNAKEKYIDLLQASRQRHKEENARLEDNRANNTDTTKARDLKTLALAEKTTIDRTRQVQARDLFLLDLPHTSGNRITSHVEVFFRDKSGGDMGDVLVCETDDVKPFLLFPPILKENISARTGDKPGQLVVLIRGEDWSEVLTLDAEEPEAAEEWLEMLGTNPVPPAIPSDAELTDHVKSVVSSVSVEKPEFFMSGALDTDNLQIPIGEKVRRGAEESSTPKNRRRVSRRTPPTDLPGPILEESVVEEIKDLNDAMNKAGSMTTPKRPRAARYHGKSSSPRPTTPQGQAPSTPGSQQTTPRQSEFERPTGSPKAEPDLPHVPKVRSSSTPTTPETPKAARLQKARPEVEDVKQRSQSAVSTREDGAPPPPAHKLPVSPNTLKKALPILDPPTPRSNNRRSSSPLKHEYQPSVDSGASDSSSESDSDDSGSYTSSEDDELETPEPEPLTAQIYPQRLSPKGSIYSIQNSTIAPSQSASQAPYSGPGPTTAENVDKYSVMGCSYWNDKGYWVDLYPDPCSLHIGPGWLKIYEHSSEPASKPLIVQVLTPIVTLAGHTLDIQVRSPLTADSKLHCKSAHIRYRMLTPTDTSRIYNALKESRMRNMFYNAMQEERRVSGFGSNNAAYEAAIKGRGRNFLGLRRKASYRATARAPSESAASSSSAISALLRSSIFNIKKSSVDIARNGSGDNSGPTSSYSSASGMTPPRTPTSFFSSSNNANVDLGSSNIKIRLYERVRHDWDDRKYAFLTVTPPEGRRQTSTLQNGLEKRILITLRPHDHPDGPGKVVMDEVLGSRCFQQLGIKGVLCTVWCDVRGPNGEVGMVGATGGVSGRQQKWLFQAKTGGEAGWILGLVTSG